MIYLLYGPDSLRRGRKLKELIDAYRKKYDSPDILEIDFSVEEESEGVLRARDFLNQPSLFVAAKVLVLKNSEGAPDEKELARIMKTELKTEKSFVFVSDAVAPKKTLAFLLSKPAAAQEFPEPSLRDLRTFIQKEAKALGVLFEPEAVEIFTEIIFGRAEGRSWHALRELEKLAVFSGGRPVSKQALYEILYVVEEKQVFRSARNILFGQSLARSLSELESLLAAKEPPSYIFNSLGFQARGEMAVRLADYDAAVKSGKLEYEEALLDFVIRKS